MARSWTQLVDEGRRLVSLEGDIKWQLGDLAMEVVPIGADGVRTAAFEKLERFAEEIGVEFEALRKYRRVASAWPAGKRFPAASWSVHEILAGRDDRFGLIGTLPVDKRTGKVRTVEAWRAMGQQVGVTNTNSLSPVSEKVRAVKTYLDEPEVRRELVRDDHVRESWSRSAREEDARNAAAAARTIREKAPALVEAREFYEAIARAQHARQDVRHLIELLLGLPPLDTEQRAMVRHELDLLAQAVEYAQSFGRGRQSASLADEIQEFLAEEVN